MAINDKLMFIIINNKQNYPTADYNNQMKRLDTTRDKQPIEISSQRIRDLVYRKMSNSIIHSPVSSLSA